LAGLEVRRLLLAGGREVRKAPLVCKSSKCSSVAALLLGLQVQQMLLILPAASRSLLGAARVCSVPALRLGLQGQQALLLRQAGLCLCPRSLLRMQARFLGRQALLLRQVDLDGLRHLVGDPPGGALFLRGGQALRLGLQVQQVLLLRQVDLLEALRHLLCGG